MRTRYVDIDDRMEDLADRMCGQPEIAREFLERYELSWLYHENALEGLVYTPQELAAAMTNPPVADATFVSALQGIKNHKLALDLVREEARAKKPRVTLALVKRLYETLGTGAGGKPAAAEFRKDMPLHRAYFHEIAQPAKIEAQLAKLLEWCESADFRSSHPIHKASKLQHSFMAIYPYTDGSGKIARLLSNLLLVNAGYQPCIIHTIDRQRYYESLKQPETALRELMLESMENGLANGEKLVREAQAARARKVVR
jgi:Fic family protein